MNNTFMSTFLAGMATARLLVTTLFLQGSGPQP